MWRYRSKQYIFQCQVEVSCYFHSTRNLPLEWQPSVFTGLKSKRAKMLFRVWCCFSYWTLPANFTYICNRISGVLDFVPSNCHTPSSESFRSYKCIYFVMQSIQIFLFCCYRYYQISFVIFKNYRFPAVWLFCHSRNNSYNIMTYSSGIK
jgi:hypothetical protein